MVIEDNRIHHCGEQPPNNHDHGIYVEAADNTVIRNNVIDHNADRGIQLYPDGDGTVITNNVIDGNGQGIIFSGEFVNGVYQASDNTRVEHNLITNSIIRYNVESYYPNGGRSGVGNVVQDNCIHGASGNYGIGGGGAGIQSPQDGFTAINNLNVAPAYSNPAAGDYSLPDGSACAQVLNGGNSGQVLDGGDGGGTDDPVPPTPGDDPPPTEPTEPAPPAPPAQPSQPSQPSPPATGSPPVSPRVVKTESRKCKPDKNCRRNGRRAKPDRRRRAKHRGHRNRRRAKHHGHHNRHRAKPHRA